MKETRHLNSFSLGRPRAGSCSHLARRFFEGLPFRRPGDHVEGTLATQRQILDEDLLHLVEPAKEPGSHQLKPVSPSGSAAMFRA